KLEAIKIGELVPINSKMGERIKHVNGNIYNGFVVIFGCILCKLKLNSSEGKEIGKIRKGVCNGDKGRCSCK
ncbi:hypothetical protein, partial [Staphylococcus saprophyticus]|uniref:hypothetical protein n=1 Tax=Staphylococcus saprophyticus TaxID=29385 RepID=UPI001C92FA91